MEVCDAEDMRQGKKCQRTDAAWSRKAAMAFCVSGVSNVLSRKLLRWSLAYGKRVSVTKVIGATVPSISSTTHLGCLELTGETTARARFIAGPATVVVMNNPS
jgi:hypothetical protein